MRPVLPQAKGQHRPHPVGQPHGGQVERRGFRFHAAVGKVDECLDHVGAAASEQQDGVVLRLSHGGECRPQRTRGPTIERHVRQQRVDRRVALGASFGRLHHRLANAARASSSVKPNREKSVIRIG